MISIILVCFFGDLTNRLGSIDTHGACSVHIVQCGYHLYCVRAREAVGMHIVVASEWEKLTND